MSDKDWTPTPPPHPRAQRPKVPYSEAARNMVYAMVRKQLDEANDRAREVPVPSDLFSVNDVHVVWFSKTLQNWKALVITTLPDELYYEVTFDGNKGSVYIDTYVKVDNQEFQYDPSGG